MMVKEDNLHTSTPCLPDSVYDLLMMLQSITQCIIVMTQKVISNSLLILFMVIVMILEQSDSNKALGVYVFLYLYESQF